MRHAASASARLGGARLSLRSCSSRSRPRLGIAATLVCPSCARRSSRPAPAAGTVTLPAGSWRTELPWLLPGDGDPAISPDGTRLAFSSARTGNREIYVADTTTGDVRRLTASRRLDDRNPAWSPDGRRIAWQVGEPGRGDVFVMRADGTRKRLLAGGPSDDIDPAWSPDGRRIAFASNRGGGLDLWASPSTGGEPELLLDARRRCAGARVEPGRQAARLQRDRRRRHAYLAAALATLETRRVTGSSGADLRPDWSPDGAPPRVHARRSRPIAHVDRARARRPRTACGGHGRRHRPRTGRVQRRRSRPARSSSCPTSTSARPPALVVIAMDGGFHLGFTSAVDSVGRGPLRIRGWRPPTDADDAGRPADRAPGRRDAPGARRRHAALPDASAPPALALPAVRELRAAARLRPRLVGRDRKSGFCLIDRYGRASVRVPHARPAAVRLELRRRPARPASASSRAPRPATSTGTPRSSTGRTSTSLASRRASTCSCIAPTRHAACASPCTRTTPRPCACG